MVTLGWVLTLFVFFSVILFCLGCDCSRVSLFLFVCVFCFLILNCAGLYFYRQWWGPLGLFVFSTLSLGLVVLLLLVVFVGHVNFTTVWFVDLGRLFFLFDIFEVNLVFCVDGLALVSSVLVLVLTMFAQYFGVEYMYREAFILRLVYLLNFFATSVVFLFFVYDFFLILVVWELIGLFSLLLVNFYSLRIYTLKAAFKTFLFSRFSDFFIFIVFFFFVLVWQASDLGLLFVQIPFFLFYNIYVGPVGVNLLNLLGFFLVISGAVKAAQFFFHVWLPDAMEAPTPASALIHSSTLVIMGIYLVIRFSILFEFSYLGNITLAVLGSVTVAVGAVSAAFQNDIKKLVAYSTVSQMGYLFCGCGFLAYREVLFYLAVHAANKAFLFILVGYIVHFFTGNTDMRFMGRLYAQGADIVFLLFFVSFNLTGLPLTSGFFAKEFLVFQTLRLDYFSLFVRLMWFFSFLLTPFYMFFLNIWVVFKSDQRFGSSVLFLSSVGYGNQPHYMSWLLVSRLFAKSTTLVLFVFFLLVTLTGDSFISGFFSLNWSPDPILFASWSGFGLNPGLFTVTNSGRVHYLLSFILLTLTAAALRYLVKLST
uniref:NADH dehydrogenase subunit 5 n=1 Tax=Euplotes cristatus TaxID=756077 RepID=UPI002E76FA01|nr:NADH dehydrogenase subunit 5 [Euplotes cristatus]UPM52050.1 NADH dehydrogenase subunit 5 [Euplotes cristatus]